MVAARTVVGISSTSVAVALFAHFIDFYGICSAVVTIWTAAADAVIFSGVMLKMKLLPGSSTVSALFLFVGKLLVLAIRFLFGG